MPDDDERIRVLYEWARLHRLAWETARRDELYPYWPSEQEREATQRAVHSADLGMARIWDEVVSAARAVDISPYDLSGRYHPNQVDVVVEHAVTRLRKRLDSTRHAREASARADAERAEKKRQRAADKAARAERRREQRERWGFLFPVRAALAILSDLAGLIPWLLRAVRALIGG